VWSERLAVQTAMVGLEEQSRDVGGASDADRRGQTLVNGAFSSRGTLAGRFSDYEDRASVQVPMRGFVRGCP
jgi:hypothetical protein